ncbi:MAG: aldo/keto reductase [Candidatus Omnitrophota bacterium]|jgi:aryl-alcohol dehydrogenase-like predicted oxidoreductase|nr:MAG: aldo/keto reductase [Candidatus Omnitrophota bacterium]
MSKITRRHFLQNSAVAIGTLVGAGSPFAAEKSMGRRSAADLVTLGKSGVPLTRLGFGTGSNGGSVQRGLGQKEFTKLARHAYDSGIRYFDTADNYDEMHEMLAEALKGIARDTYFIQTKLNFNRSKNVPETIDRFRKELQTDYFDSLLLHCVGTATWPTELERSMEEFSKAKEKQIIRSHGASCHGLAPLRTMTQCPWLDIALVRVNHDGTHMDGPTGQWAETGNRDEALTHIRQIHANGTGVIGMKIIGNGDFTDAARRDASIKFVMGLDCVDVVVIGFKSVTEIDEAIGRMNAHLNA